MQLEAGGVWVTGSQENVHDLLIQATHFRTVEYTAQTR